MLENPSVIGLFRKALMSYNKLMERTGQRGSELHEAIVNWTRFDLLPYIRTVFSDTEWSGIYWDQFMMVALGTDGQDGTARKNGLCPDGLWVYDTGNIVIEVGRYFTNKWHEDQQVLHIGFDGQVNAINPQDDFVSEVADAIRVWRMEFISPTSDLM